jgi:hypothetical protein
MTPPVHDSGMNFSEMWDTGVPPVGAGIAGSLGTVYFEINEDFNLDLKLDAGNLRENPRNEVWSRLGSVQWGDGIAAKPRAYQQGTFVLQEWDFDFLGLIGNEEAIVQRIASILDAVIKALD